MSGKCWRQLCFHWGGATSKHSWEKFHCLHNEEIGPFWKDRRYSEKYKSDYTNYCMKINLLKMSGWMLTFHITVWKCHVKMGRSQLMSYLSIIVSFQSLYFFFVLLISTTIVPLTRILWFWESICFQERKYGCHCKSLYKIWQRVNLLF